mmetsp:Transcript_6238/g.6517  ORF Transcript_6238/g.6517 Transcript_6238/m.6517 type:complete len:236 (+) Transcript_6238:50-757(+)
MTTAHRPTWKPAVGTSINIGFKSQQVSVKDQIGMTKLKFRQVGQSSKNEMEERNILEELEKREYEQLSAKNKAILEIEKEEKKIDSIALLKNHEEKKEEIKQYNDSDVDYDERDDEFDSSSDEESDEDDDDDEDDELELQRELEKIKAERALAQAKKEEEERAIEEALTKESALRGNPLLNLGGNSNTDEKLKRKWNDDVVFRNQTRTEPEQKKRFVNDTIRSDFHRSFLKKYIH